jgi:hypothetical protein
MLADGLPEPIDRRATSPEDEVIPPPDGALRLLGDVDLVLGCELGPVPPSVVPADDQAGVIPESGQRQRLAMDLGHGLGWGEVLPPGGEQGFMGGGKPLLVETPVLQHGREALGLGHQGPPLHVVNEELHAERLLLPRQGLGGAAEVEVKLLLKVLQHLHQLLDPSRWGRGEGEGRDEATEESAPQNVHLGAVLEGSHQVRFLQLSRRRGGAVQALLDDVQHLPLDQETQRERSTLSGCLQAVRPCLPSMV